MVYTSTRSGAWLPLIKFNKIERHVNEEAHKQMVLLVQVSHNHSIYININFIQIDLIGKIIEQK